MSITSARPAAHATAAALMVLLGASSARSQTPDPDTCAPYVLNGVVLTCSASGSMRDQLRTATFIAGSTATGETLAQAVALEVATAPIGSSSGGFIYSFIERSRQTVRTSGTFGPAFSERALTVGRGQLSGGFNVIYRDYDTIDASDLDALPTFRFVGGSLPVTESLMNLEVRTTTLAAFAHYGVLDDLDVGLLLPVVSVSVQGASRIFGEAAQELQRVGFDGSATGLGDIAIFAKYRFLHIGPPAAVEGDPSADLAALATLRLPSGDTDELLGLGVTRLALAFVGSANLPRVTPHLNVGYEFWSDAISLPRDFQNDDPGIFVQHQMHYAVGIEYEAHPRLTFIGDVLGRYQRGGGRVGFQPTFFPPNRFDVQGADAVVGIPYGFSQVMLAPGAKWNFHDAALLTVSVLVPVTDGGLRDDVTPVVGIDWGF